MSYPVPMIPHGSVMWENDIKITPAADLLKVLNILDTQYADKPIGYDIEATGLNPFAEEWDLTGFTLSVRTGYNTGISYYIDCRYPNQPPHGFIKDYFANWLKKNEKRLWAFNNSYEYKGAKRVLGRSYHFSDARALSVAAHVSGGLKHITQTYCAAHDWEIQNSAAVNLLGTMIGKLRRVNVNYPVATDEGDEIKFESITGLQAFRRIQKRRRQQEEAGALETDIYKFLTKEEISWVTETYNFPAVADYIRAKIDARKTGTEPTKTIYIKGEPREVTWELSANEVLVESAIMQGLKIEDILCGTMYDPSTGWGTVPTRILGPYCGWDGFYTIILRDSFIADERLAKAYPFFEEEINFSGVLESYGQCWDDRSTSELDHKYLVIANDSLAELVKTCDLGEDDEWNQRARIVEGLSKGCTLPFRFDFKYNTGGDYYAARTEWIYNVEELTAQLNALEAIMAVRIDAGKDPKKSDVKKRDELKSMIEAAPARRQMVEDSFRTGDPKIGNWVINYLDESKKDWREVATLAQYQEVTRGHRIKYIDKVLRDTIVETKVIRVETESQRLEILKGYFNPGSNTEASIQSFWKPYMTPMVITANLFYGIMKYFETADQWDYVAGWMVDTEIQDVDKDGVPKVDEDGDPVFKKELRPRTIKFVDNATGQIEEINEIQVNKKDLRQTIVNLNNLYARLTQKVDYKWLDTSPDKIKELKAINEFAAQYQEMRREAYTSSQNLASVIRKAIDGMSGYISSQTQGFASTIVELQHQVHQEFLGLKLMDKATWSPEYHMIINLRLYKKCMKNRSTYLVGDKLGRGSVSVAVVPPTDGSTQEGIMHTSMNPPILRTSYWAELEESDSYAHMHGLSDHRQLYLATDFNPVSTETRRWRSRNHTVPAESELRRCYFPRNHSGIMDHSDFSGMELATVAAIAGEEVMIQAFIDGDDIHMKTAMGVYGLPREEVTPMMRRYAKICTFLTLYGGELPALAAAVGGSMARAKQIMEGFYSAYPKLKQYIDTYRRMAKEHGYVYTISGAPLNIDRNNPATVGTTSINYPIQGSATMVGGVSFFRMWKTAQELGLPLIPTSFTHDSLDSEQHPASYFLTKALMKFMAEKEVLRQWRIPARLDGESGTSTYELVHTKIKSKFDAGTESNPHILELKGPEHYLDNLVDKFRPWYDIEIEKEYKDTVTSEIKELWIAKRAFNTNMISGTPYDEYKATIKLARKTDLFIPDLDHPIYQRMQEAGL